MALLVLSLRLAAGPLSLGFAAPSIERQLAQRTGGLDPDFAAIELVWDGGPDIRVREVRLRDSAGREVLAVPEMAVGLKTLPLLSGRAEIRSLSIIGPSLTVFRRPNGSFGLREVSTPRDGEAAGLDLAPLLTVLRDPAGPEELSLLDGRVRIRDRASGIDRMAENLNIVFRRTDAGVVYSAEAQIPSDGKDATLAASGAFKADGGLSIELDIARLAPAMMAGEFGIYRYFRGVDVLLDGALRGELDATGAIGSASLAVSVSSGRLETNWLSDAVDVQQGQLQVTFEPDSGRLVINEIVLEVEQGRMVAEGSVLPSEDDLVVEARGGFTGLSFADLVKIWPAGFKDSSRDWIDRNIAAGVLDEGRFRVDTVNGIEEGDGGDFILEFVMSGVEGHYLRPMPPLKGASGRGRLVESAFTFSFERATITPRKGGPPLRLVGLDAVLDPLDQPVTHYADIRARFAGPVKALVRVLDEDPLGYPRSYGISDTSIDGDAELQMRFHFPLIDALGLDDVDISASADIGDLRLTGVLGPLPIENGTMRITVDNERLEASGSVEMDSMPLDLRWREEFKPGPGEDPSRFDLSGQINLNRFSQAEAVMELGGACQVDLSLSGDGFAISQGDLRAELEAAEVALPMFEWSKQAGEAASFSARLGPGEKGLNIRDFSLEGTDLDIRGIVELGPGFGFRSVTLTRAKIGETDAELVARKRSAASYALRLTGKRVHLAPMLEGLLQSGGSEQAMGNLELDIDLAEVSLLEGVELRGIKGMARYVAGWLEEAHLGAEIAESREPLFLSISRSGLVRDLFMAAENAGAVTRGLGLFDGARGGRVRMEAVINDRQSDSPTLGVARIEGFRLAEAPGIARVLSLASLTGIGDMLSGQGLTFDRFQADFKLSGDTIALRNARGSGSQIGISLAGTVDNAANRVNLQGTLVPAYTLNTVLGFVPVIGDLLTGGPGGGLFAIGFSLNGPADDPNVSVDPLSALAPGFLRGMVNPFEDALPDPQAMAEEAGLDVPLD